LAISVSQCHAPAAQQLQGKTQAGSTNWEPGWGIFCGGSLSLIKIIMRNTACSKDLAAHLPPCPKKVEMTKRES